MNWISTRATLFAALLVLPLAAQGDQTPAAGSQGQQVTQNVFTVDFGGGVDQDGDPKAGFRVVFDRFGGGIRSIAMLDHFELEKGPEGERIPYQIVQRELQNPTMPDSSPTYVSFDLKRQDSAGVTALDGVQWSAELIGAVEGTNPTQVDAVVFRVVDGLYTWTKTFAYDRDDANPRRDLRFDLSVAAQAGSQAPAGVSVPVRLTGFPLATPESEYILGQNPSIAGAALRSPDGDIDLESLVPSDSDRALAGGLGSQRVAFAGTVNRFFGGFIFPVNDDAVQGIKGVEMDTGPRIEQNGTPPGSAAFVKLGLQMPLPAAGQERSMQFRVYLGPKDYDAFQARPEYENAGFGLMIEAAFETGCFCPIPMQTTMGKLMTWILGVLQSIFVNWGLSIVALTLVVRGVLFPINFRMQKSMRAYGSKMAKLKPQLDAIQKKYAADRQRLQQEMLKFQKEHKIFPPVGGCLPIFLTMPIYIGLFSALRVSYDLRQQPFVGWIDDLSRPDALFDTGIDFWVLDHFNLLPFIYVILNLYLVSRQPLPNDPQQRQVATMMRFIPLVFGIMLYGYAAGMFVYMITSGIWSLFEQRLVKKILGPIDPNAAAVAPTPAF